MVFTRQQSSRTGEGERVETQVSQGAPSSSQPTSSSQQVSNPTHTETEKVVEEVEQEGVIQNYGKVLDKHILKGWLDAHFCDLEYRLPRVPLCRLLSHPSIRTNDDEVEMLKKSIDEHTYQPTMAGFIVTESMPGEDPIPVDRDYIYSQGRELAVSVGYDNTLEVIPQWTHMREKMFVVWDGNHRVRAWQEWAKEKNIASEDRPSVECRVVRLKADELAEFLMVLRIVNRTTGVVIPHTQAHDIFMMQKVGLADPRSLLEKFSVKDREWAMRAIKAGGPNKAKWLKLPMPLLAQLVFKDEFDAMYATKTEGHPRIGSSEYMSRFDDWEKSYALALEETETFFTKKGHSLAQIANPENGTEWFQEVMSYRGWLEKTNRFTIPKLAELARTRVQNTE